MVRAIMIVEIAGRPPEHIKAVLTEHVGVMEKIKDLKVHSIKVHEPKLIENSPDVHTCFAEVDIDAPTFARLGDIVFDFMPSSIEVMEPSKVSMDLSEATAILNNVAGRLHKYDEIAKMAQFRIHQLTAQLEAATSKAPVEEVKLVKKKGVKPSKKKTVSAKAKKK